MAHVPLPSPTVPQANLLAAFDALTRATEPPLTDPDAPVRLADLPPEWRAYLHDEADSFADLVPPNLGEVRRSDWTGLLARLRRHIEIPFRMAEILALVERGPTPEDLERAPRLSPWSLALAFEEVPVMAGHVTDHPRLGETWMRSSMLMGLDPERRWARTWTRWYRLGEHMTDDDHPAFWQAGVPAELIGTDDAQVAQHFGQLRARTAHLLASLASLASRPTVDGESRP